MKKIGIILGGDLPSSLVAKHGDYASILKETMRIDQHAECITWHADRGELPDDITGYDSFLIAGHPTSVNEGEGWIEGLAEFVRRAQHEMKRVAGICFGHHLVHYALGGKVEPNDQGWLMGNYAAALPTSGRPLSLISAYKEQVSEAAEGFKVIAGADWCPNYFTGRGDQFLTVQGHPEFSNDFFHDYLQTRQDRFSAELLNAAKNSTRFRNDASLVLALMNAFLLA
ncbi:glutamine amidotransferase-related protein [Thaumasiovibrio subtropicus]|uniref:glutamine amidotransferase-related protein n=1 Tax=Thaumasiovibrio subtropicus TaxID=1891207 RepID=UPI000B35FED5|nr:hypothetical protein [Thaumasiovibrio subtropicus]